MGKEETPKKLPEDPLIDPFREPDRKGEPEKPGEIGLGIDTDGDGLSISVKIGEGIGIDPIDGSVTINPFKIGH